MKITAQDVRYIADLAHLELTPEEIVAMERDLGAILEYVAQLDQLEMPGLAPSPLHPAAAALAALSSVASNATLRPDAQHSWFTPAEALANAPSAGAGHFKVPRIISVSEGTPEAE
ncbi:MAG: Asp-tRNA(Asn)/Glu-tRNA(Gln) amidotransferase subunit GatC [Terriglobales bacterium]